MFLDKLIISNEAELGLVVNSILSHKTESVFTVALTGDLGAGKTTLVKKIASTLGIPEVVTSPTYIIYKSYTVPQNQWGIETLVHMDAYRIENQNELTPLRFSELFKPGTMVCIEWPSHIIESLPDKYLSVELKSLSESAREVIITANELPLV